MLAVDSKELSGQRSRQVMQETSSKAPHHISPRDSGPELVSNGSGDADSRRENTSASIAPKGSTTQSSIMAKDGAAPASHGNYTVGSQDDLSECTDLAIRTSNTTTDSSVHSATRVSSERKNADRSALRHTSSRTILKSNPFWAEVEAEMQQSQDAHSIQQHTGSHHNRGAAKSSQDPPAATPATNYQPGDTHKALPANGFTSPTKRMMPEDGSEDDDEQDGFKSKKQAGYTERATVRRVACPFYKRDMSCAASTACNGLGFQRQADLKWVISRCFRSFADV